MRKRTRDSRKKSHLPQHPSTKSPPGVLTGPPKTPSVHQKGLSCTDRIRTRISYIRRASPVPIALEPAFRTSEGPLLYRSHPNSHFVHQRGLSCTKVRGLAVDDERRDNGGFLPSRVRRAGSAVFTRHGGAGSESERSPPAARGKPPERQYRIRTGFGENRATWVMHVGKISRGAARRMGAGR